MTDIRCYRSPQIEVRSSDLAGRGVFAREPIKKDELVAIKAAHIVTTEQLAEITANVGDYALQIHDGFFLTPTTVDEIERMVVFINHSCDPNVGFAGQVAYVAMRDIRPGEELCHDYAMERTDNYSLACTCGSEICRGTVTGNDWRSLDLQNKYGNYFSSYIWHKIRRLKEAAE